LTTIAGIGIPPESIGLLFLTFSRLDNPETRRNGVTKDYRGAWCHGEGGIAGPRSASYL
jgi:hypothetical protein